MRLFVGGLSVGVDNELLTSKLSPYGSILNAEVKEKVDAEGVVTQRFAYVNVDASREDLEQCIRDLNGSEWEGSTLRVEVAKESFLDRLKRERDGRKGQYDNVQYFSHYEKAQKLNKYQSSKVDSQKRDYEVFRNEKTKRRNFEVESNLLLETIDAPDSRQNKNKKEEELLASFKTFSSVWADSDEEEGRVISNKEMRKIGGELSKKKDNITNDKSGTSDSESDSAFSESEEEKEESSKSMDKRQNWGAPKTVSLTKMEVDDSFKPMTRYDPTLENDDQSMEEDDEDTTSDKEVEVKKPESDVASAITKVFGDEEEKPVEKKTIRKKYPFFLKPEDERIQEGFDWMLQNNQEKILPQYKADEENLYEVVKMRSVRLQKEMNKQFDKGRTHKEKNKGEWNSFKNSFTSMSAEHMYDHDWRKTETTQFEKRRGGHNSGKRTEQRQRGRQDFKVGSRRQNFDREFRGRQDSNRGRQDFGRGYRSRGRGLRGRQNSNRGREDYNEGRGNYKNQRDDDGLDQGTRGRDIKSAWFGNSQSQDNS